MSGTAQRDRLVVYTVLMGQPAELNPVPDSPNVDFVCFTDQQLERPNGWTVKHVELALPDDSPRSSRHPKVLPHLYLAEYSRSIYIDTSVLLRHDPEHLWSRLMPQPENVFGAIYHSYRFSMFDLIKAVSFHRFDDDRVLLKQLEASEHEYPGYVNARPVWGAILARRHNDQDLIRAMEHWYSYIINYSRRDQTSLPLAIRMLRGNQVSLAHVDNHESDFYEWPSGGFHKPESYLSSDTNAIDWSDYEPAERDALLSERNELLFERDARLESSSWRIARHIRALGLVFRNSRDST